MTAPFGFLRDYESGGTESIADNKRGAHAGTPRRAKQSLSQAEQPDQNGVAGNRFARTVWPEGRTGTGAIRYRPHDSARLDHRRGHPPRFHPAGRGVRRSAPADDLPQVPFGTWGKLLFASLDPAFPLAELTAEMDARISWLPLREAVLDPGAGAGGAPLPSIAGEVPGLT